MTPATSSDAQWPPRSPHEALLSTPGGRQRYREMLNRTSPSPSPSRSARRLAAVTSSPGATLKSPLLVEAAMDDDEDEDEETLQLKLEEIQARLKLKKLQSAKAKVSPALSQPDHVETTSNPMPAPPPSRRTARAKTPEGNENDQHTYERIQVPASPVRTLQLLRQQTSPSKFLGIDKGRRAKDISLKRAPGNSRGGSYAAAQAGRQLSQITGTNMSTASSDIQRPLSFNERLAAQRADEQAQAEKRARVEKARTSAFSMGQVEMDRYKQNAQEILDEPIKAPTFTREQVLSQPKRGLPQSRTMPNLPGEQSDDSASFEAYSSFFLSRRILPHNVVTRHVSGTKIMNVKDLLRQVKAPNFALPDVEQDIVFFAVVARKSEARSQAQAKNRPKDEDPPKYMILTLCDLTLEVDLYLFQSGFTRFWKITEGTVVAILNPNIMPPPQGRADTGKFSLVINSDDATVLEIGMSRDLGFCQSKKKDGELCMSWVNKKKTHFCEYHSNDAVRKQRGSRIEVNMSDFGGGGRGIDSRFKNSREMFMARGATKDEQKAQARGNYDWDTKTSYFTSRTMSASDLLDGKDRTPSDRRDKEEFVRRNLEAKEKERDMMKRLGKIGGGAGREYMERAGIKASSENASASSSSQAMGDNVPSSSSQLDAVGLGLISKDRAVHLSPIKRKRPDSWSRSQASSTVGSSSSRSFGWGSNLKDKLSKMKEGENLLGRAAPARKKTRFVTEKGIREAGRESLGTELATGDDEDELVII